MLLFLAFYESNICSAWKFFVFSSRRLTLTSMLIDCYFRSNVSRNLTDEFTRRGRWGRFAPLPPLNRNLHLWYKNENSPRPMTTNGHAINFCHLSGIYITDQRQIENCELFTQFYCQQRDVLVKVNAKSKKRSCTTKIVSRVTIF